MPGITIYHYQNRAEFLLEHPELELLKIQIIPRGQSDDKTRRELQSRNIQTRTAVTIGSVLYIPAEEPRCSCKEYAGDDPGCPIHGGNHATQ